MALIDDRHVTDRCLGNKWHQRQWTIAKIGLILRAFFFTFALETTSNIAIFRYMVPITPIYELPSNEMKEAENNFEMDIDAILKALANPTRRQILAWLKDPSAHFSMQAYPLELGVCAGLIDQRAGLSQSTVSAHLATLQRAGLITSRKVGQWIFFKRNEELISRFIAQLDGGL